MFARNLINQTVRRCKIVSSNFAGVHSTANCDFRGFVPILTPCTNSKSSVLTPHQKFTRFISTSNCDKMIIQSGNDTILVSDYASKPVNHGFKNICEALLAKAKDNLKAGRTKWMTNSITGETLTFSDVEMMSRKVASFLVKRGMKPGDKCIYLTSNITRMFAIGIGIWRAGGVVCSSYAEDTQETLGDRIQDYKAKWIFCDPSSVPQCHSAAKSASWPVEVIVFGKSEGCTPVDLMFQDDGSDCPSEVKGELGDPSLILCTSGTTGKSKGAIYTNQSVINFCLATDDVPRNNPKPALWLLKGTHVLGFLYPMRNIFVGDHSVMMHQINKENIFHAVHTYHPFLVFGFPLFLTPLVTDPEADKIDRSSLEIVCSGGIVLKDSFYETMSKLPNVRYVINGFGMTECGAITTTVDISKSLSTIRAVPNIPPLSVGKLYTNTKLKVFDLETGKTVGPLKQGELCVSSPVLCAGYWNRPAENAENFKEDEHGRWMKTGDLGYYDENGFVFVQDRLKETFKYFNNHISPAELEEYLLLHPSIKEACVFGMKDPEGGDHIPRAIVVLKPGMKADPKEIASFVSGKVAVYKQLRGGVFLVDSLPRGKTGKVLRSAAAELYGK